MTPVAKANLRCGSASILKPEFKSYWWELELACGHVVERRVRYKPGGEKGYGRQWKGSNSDDILPAQKRAECERCI
jgi:hypothetical protein